MPFRHQHALHFAQNLVRIGAEFEHVRQHQQIDAVAGKRQVGKFGAQINIAVRRDATVHGNAVGAQKIVFGQAELQRVEAEHIGDRVVDVFKLAREHEVLITIEEGSVGGFGSMVLQVLTDNDALDGNVKFRSMVLPDTFIDQDSPAAMYAKAGLDAKGIVAKVFEVLGKNVQSETVRRG